MHRLSIHAGDQVSMTAHCKHRQLGRTCSSPFCLGDNQNPRTCMTLHRSSCYVSDLPWVSRNDDMHNTHVLPCHTPCHSILMQVLPY